MKILGIETSCDDTCISLIKAHTKNKNLVCFEILANNISSQNKIHEKWGGIYPSLARREHQKNLTLVLEKTLAKEEKTIYKNYSQCFNDFLQKDSLLEKELSVYLKKTKKPEIDAIAVTVGPGLDPCLWTGINFAKTIACYWQIPIIPVNHIESHLIISLFSLKKNCLTPQKKNIFPAIGLIISGGHTQIVLMKSINNYTLLGETRDDAAGECFDKTARIIGLGYPGGPAIYKEAQKLKKSDYKIELPRPMMYSKDYDFSFSGLKTAVLYKHKSMKKKPKQYLALMAHEIQQSIIDVLYKKTTSAVKEKKVKSLIVGGGVSANKTLYNKFKEIKNIEVIFPPQGTQTDNALMTAVTGYFKKNKPLNEIKAQPNLKL